MNSYAFDTFKSEKITNNMKEFGELNINDFDFMPTLEILPYGEKHADPSKSFDINSITD